MWSLINIYMGKEYMENKSSCECCNCEPQQCDCGCECPSCHPKATLHDLHVGQNGEILPR